MIERTSVGDPLTNVAPEGIHPLKTLEICQRSRWYGHADGVRNRHKVDDLLQNGSFQCRQVAQGSGNHSKNACSHTA